MQKWKLVSICAVLSLVAFAIALLLYWNIKHCSDRYEAESKEQYLRELVNMVNSNTKSSWKAKYNKFGEKVRGYDFQNLRRDFSWVRGYYQEVKEFAESPGMQQHLRELETLYSQPLPDSFDSREKWPHCSSLYHIPNQGGCGSCYVVAAVGVASDRLCIHSNGSFRSVLSAQDALTCCEHCGGCYGGDPLKVLTYFVKDGLVTAVSLSMNFGGRDGCKPYEMDISCGVPCSPDTYQLNEGTRRCERRCQHIYYQNEYKDDKHHGRFAYSLAPRRYALINEKNEQVKVPTVLATINKTRSLGEKEKLVLLKHEVMNYGPITLTFPVTEEFLHYYSGVFRPYPVETFPRRIIYWHVVRIIGWGTEKDGSHYWLAVNSFGSQWGENGLFKLNIDALQSYGLEYETVL